MKYERDRSYAKASLKVVLRVWKWEHWGYELRIGQHKVWGGWG